MLLQQEQRQGISQRIDPKLIMANAILQQSSIELVQQIEAELLENPALDMIEEETPCVGDCPNPALCPYCSQRAAQQVHTHSLSDEETTNYVDGVFEADEDYDPVGNLEAELTLQEHLCTLLRAAVSEEDYPIGEYIIQSLNDSGLIDAPLEELAREIGVTLEDVCRVLAVIQTFDPPGVGAQNLQECMLIQLRFLNEEGQGHPLAERLVRDHFDEIANRRYGRIARGLGVNTEKARQAVEFVRAHLNPHPAAQFRAPWTYKPTNSRSAVRPDVIIRRTEIGYEVDVTGGETFVLGISPTYREAYEKIRKGQGRMPEEEKQHVREYVERAELFIKNINQRRKTLRLITKCIIECQQGFLETSNRAYLRSLTRTRVAEMLGMHESTVSRATAKKYVQLPNQEVVAFDMFFNASLSIKTYIEEIIAKEDPSSPLSDRRIVELLKEQGISVARRTVVKYRDSQKLLSSNRRRR